MYAKYDSMTKERRESFAKGTGGGWSRYLIPMGSDIPGSNFTMVAENTLDPGTNLGFHIHEADDELYVILEGEGVYYENKEAIPAGPGDMFFLARGNGHALNNTGQVPLRFLAVIAK